MFEHAPLPDSLTCLFCGYSERVEIFEVWGHEFMLETCCEGLYEQIVRDMNDDPIDRDGRNLRPAIAACC